MRHYTILFFLSLLSVSTAYSQKSYWASGGEIIFSYGTVHTDSTTLNPVLRWSPFFNAQAQFHHDFSETAGIYTGLGIRNVGLISHINYKAQSDSTLKTGIVKERSYSLGIPIAIKLGNMEKVYFAGGGEAELMFAYKRKVYDQGNKSEKNKTSSWFNDNVKIFNPSVFAELHLHSGPYIRFKYYLLDFLNYQGVNMKDGTPIPDYGSKSPLFYFAIGSTDIISHTMSTTSTPKSTSAYFKTKKKSPVNDMATVKE